MKKVLIRTSTIPSSMRVLLTGQLKFMSDYYDVIAVSSGGEHYDKLLEEQGVRGYIVPFTRSTFSLISDLKAFLMLIKIFRKEKPFIVHSHTSKDGLLCMVAAWLCRVPNRLYTIAGLADLSGIRGKMLDIAEWVTFWCATGLYPISSNMMEIYIKKGMFKRSKSKVILNGSSNGFDFDYFNSNIERECNVVDLKQKLVINEDSFVFCSIGRIVKDKGINELVNSFLKLCKEYPNIRLLLLGSFEKFDLVDKDVEYEILNNDKILYVGYQSDIRPYLEISNALVHASYREGFGNVIAQAGLMNIACIVTNICGPNEIILDGVNGSIIPRKNTDALYGKMKYFVENKEEVKKMGENSRQLIIDRYNRNELWNAILEEYKSLENKL